MNRSVPLLLREYQIGRVRLLQWPVLAPVLRDDVFDLQAAVIDCDRFGLVGGRLDLSSMAPSTILIRSWLIPPLP